MGGTSSGTGFRAALLHLTRTHARSILPLAAAVLVGVVVVGLLIGIYALLLGKAAYAQLVELASSPETATLVSVIIITPMALLGLLACLVWAGTAVAVANAAAGSRRISTAAAALVALRRAPRAAAIAAIVLLAFVAAVVAAPILMVVGIVRLLLRRSTSIAMAIPFGAAVVLLLRWSLALPSLWLANSGIRVSLADSAQRTAGRKPAIAVTLLLAGLVTLGATEGLVSLFTLDVYAELVTRLAALILLGPLVPVGLALLYRAGGEAPPAPRQVEPRLARRTRTAVAVILSLVIPFTISVNPAPATAAGTGAVLFQISTVEAQPLPVGTPTTMQFTVQDLVTAEGPQPTGQIAISVDGTPLTGPFVLGGAGSVVQVPYTFSAGSHVIDAGYPGDANYEAKTATLTVQAGSPPPYVATTTAFTITPASVSPAGGTLTAHVTVTPNEGSSVPTGTVGIYIDDQSQPPLAEAALTAGQADLVFVLPPGSNHVVVYFTGDPGFHDSHIDETQYVGRFAPSVALSVAPGSVSGESVALSATVSAGMPATGTVTFEVTPAVGAPVSFGPAAVNGSGVATATATGLALGGHTVVATYSGDSSVSGGSSAATTHTVATAGVDVTVDSSVGAPRFGDTALLTVTVAPTAPATGVPTGSVTLTRDDGAVFGPTPLTFAGRATFSVGVGDAGDSTYTASYTGDASFEPGSGSLELEVEKAETTTTLAPVPGPGTVYGDSVTYSGTVAASGSTPTGTVQLWAGAQQFASGALSAGSFSISSNRMPAGSAVNVWAVYVPDANHVASETARQQMQVVKAQPALVLSASDTDVTIGDTITLTADLASLGAGPSGTVTFTNLTTDPDTVLGSPTIVGDTVMLDIVVTAATMQIVAAYAGDGNFQAQTTPMLTITGERVTPTVVLDPVGAIEYGTLVTLEATVTPAGLVPAGGVEFRSAGLVFGTVVPDSTGHATLEACAGEVGACPGATVFLGGGALNLTARSLATIVSFEADSAPVAYSITPAATTTTVSINPTVVDPGAGIYLTATVDGVTSAATPAGDVTFYASMPDGMGGFAPSLVATQPLDANGVATVFVTAGTGPTDIRWPAAAITAHYFPIPNTRFATSTGSTPVTVDRYDVTLSGQAPLTVTPSVPATVSVSFTHEPGTSAPYTGTLTITPDVGSPCTVTLPVAPPASCTFTWATSGAHSFTASYSGDLVYEPATLAPVTVNVGVGAPNFVPLMSSSAVAETDFTVSWNGVASGATGTVTVWGDGSLWCTTPLATLSCTGQFGVASATGSPVDVVVRYSGDANWGPAEIHTPVTVARCVVPDVRSANPSLGTVHISTASNCGVGGFLTGTHVVATAAPIPPNVFVDWKKLGGTGLVTDTTTLSTAFTLTTDSTTWVRVASFNPPCYPVTAAVTGHGAVSVYPATNCTSLSGVAGYTSGTSIAVYPDPLFSPYYAEPDAFYAFGDVAGASVGTDSSGRTRLVATVTGATSIPVTFGPQCRPIRVVFSPSSVGDQASAEPGANCTSPQATGFLRYTSVTVAAQSGDPSLAITGWLLNGVPQPDWGTAEEQTVVIGSVVPVLTAQLVHCYRLEVTVDGALDARNRPVGAVNTDVEPNCPDGSDRYLTGTKVTLTPEILIDGAAFTGWDSARISPVGIDGVGEITAQDRVVTMTADLTTTAGFILKETCSPISISGARGILEFEDDGCGQGQYFDAQKQAAIRTGELQIKLWQQKHRTELIAHPNPAVPLDIYVSVRGDTTHCFGGPGLDGYNTSTDEWKTYGPLTDATESCFVGGPIDVQVETCQRIVAKPQFQVAGDVSGRVFPRGAIPDSVYLADRSGMVGAFDLNAFDWMQSANIYLDGTSIKPANYGDDACTRSGSNTYQPGRELALYAFGPTTGFGFGGWDGVAPAGLVEQNPVLADTTKDSATQTVYPVYTVTCHTLSLGSGISVLGTPAYCPGSDPAENSFIAGTAVQVKADRIADGRTLHGFKTGVVASQIWEDDKSTKNLIGFAVVDGDKPVRGDYPSNVEAAGRSIVQNLKVVVGVLAVMAPIALGMLFPPAGMFFAFLGAGAGIANLIPGGAEVASVLDLINPTKITTCAARWGFTNAGDPTGGYGVGGMISTANTLRKVYNGVDVVFEKVGPLGMAGGAASLAYGLYDAGAGNVDTTSPQSVEQLRGTSTMTGCLDDQWKIAGSNISGK